METAIDNQAESIESENTRSFKVPELRFPEFEGEWKKTNLGETFRIFNGYAFSSADSVKNGVPWVKIADVGIQKMKRESLSFLPAEFAKKHSKFLLKKGDYVVALTRPILNGKLKIAQIDNFFDQSLLNQRVGKIESFNCVSFIFNLLQKDELIKSIENNIAGSDPPNLSPSEIKTIKIYLPALPEQQKIASFLTAVDTKIQQLTKKKKLLEQYKKGVMQQIFTRQIRFKDEDGNDYPDWEEKRLGELFSYVSPNSFSRNLLNYENGTVKNIHYGDIHTKYSATFDIDVENVPFINEDVNIQKVSDSQYCREGDLIVADASEDYKDVGKAIEIINLNGQKLLSGLHTFLARDENNLTAIGFKAYLMQQYSVRIQIMKAATGISVLGISKTNFSKVKIHLPKKAEQQKIANFLTGIDKKINLINKQLEQVKLFKKGLLQQMFV